MLLLHLVLTRADAGPDLCTVQSDLCTLRLWWFSSFNWCKHTTCTSVVCHQLQLALMVLFYPATSAKTALALGELALCGGGQYWRYVTLLYVEVEVYISSHYFQAV